MSRGRWRVAIVVAGATAMAVAALTVPAAASPAVAGDQAWVQRYTGAPTRSFNLGQGLALSPDRETVYVTGVSQGSTSKSVTIAYGSDGTRRWTAAFGPPGAFEVTTARVRVSPDGSRVFVSGVLEPSQNDSSLLVIAYDAATGSRLWVRTYKGKNDFVEFGGAIDLSPDGSKVFVTGEAGPVTGGFANVTVGYAAATGTRLWVSRLPGSPTDIAVSPDGSTVYVTGNRARPGSFQDATTVAYDAETGARRWLRRMVDPYGFSLGNALAVSPDGAHVFVTAGAESADGVNDLSDFLTASYDATTGHQEWITRYNSPRNKYDLPTAIAVAHDGSAVFVTGQSGGKYVTIAYAVATGTQQWASTYTSGEKHQDAPDSIASGPDGVVVTGVSPSATSDDIATVSYDPLTGAQQWVARYDGPAGDADSGSAVVADPAGGRVYVVGHSLTGNTSAYVTLAYDTV